MAKRNLIYDFSFKSLIIYCFVSTLTSCNKDYKTTNISNRKSEISKEVFLQEAKILLENERKALGSDTSFIGTPDWGKHYFGNIESGENFLIVPLSNYVVDVSYTKTMNPSGSRNIMFTKLSPSKINIEIVELHPDNTEEMYTDYSQKANMFTGYYLTYSIQNNLIQGHHRTHGVADKFLKVPNTIFQNPNL